MAEGLQRILPAEAEFLLYGAAAQLLIISPKGGGQRVFEAIDHARYSFSERLCSPRWEL